jgi:acetate kinase
LQSTRCGDLDPAAVTYIMRKENLDPAAMDRVLTRESGWYGISGLGNDLQDIEAAAVRGNERAKVALDVFIHRMKKYVGAYAAVMGGLDGLIFSGGIGEKSSAVRAAVCRGLEFLGIRLDEELNAGTLGDAVISVSGAQVKILVVKTDEELYIARETHRVAGNA